MNDVIKPTICVCAPARTCITGEGADQVDVGEIDACVERLRALGWRVTETPNVRELDHGFAGDDAHRARGVMDAFADPDTDLVLPIRGGYGTARILPLLDWEAIGRSEAVFAGLSDLTAMNLALFSRCNRASWQGPVAHAFARGNALFEERFMRAMRESVFSFESPVKAWGVGKNGQEQGESGQRFAAEGPVWGGNLTILLSLLGTPWFPRPEQIEGGILIVEDIYVTAWRLERMLVQLAQCGILARQRSLVVGDVTGHAAGLKGPNSGIALEDALHYVSHLAGIPVFVGLPFGHREDTMTLPVGCPGAIAYEDGRLQMTVDNPPVPAEYPGAEASRKPLWWV